MANKKSSELLANAATTLTADELLESHVIDILAEEKTLDSEKNQVTTIGAIREHLGIPVTFTGAISLGDSSVAITFATAFATVPEFISVQGYQSTDEANVDVYVDPGTLTATGCTIKAKSTSHSGIKLMGTVIE